MRQEGPNLVQRGLRPNAIISQAKTHKKLQEHPLIIKPDKVPPERLQWIPDE